LTKKNDLDIDVDIVDDDDDEDDDDANGDAVISKVEQGGVAVSNVNSLDGGHKRNIRERRNVVSTVKTVQMHRITSIEDYMEQLQKVRYMCSNLGLVPLYYYTSAEGAESLLSSGFKMSNNGDGVGGVYFDTNGPCYYGVGSNEYERNLISEIFGEEKVDEYLGKGKLDLVLIYGADPSCVESISGGKKYSKLIGKHLFEDLTLPAKDGQYYLRPDRIQAALIVNFKSMKGNKTASSLILSKFKITTDDDNAPEIEAETDQLPVPDLPTIVDNNSDATMNKTSDDRRVPKRTRSSSTYLGPSETGLPAHPSRLFFKTKDSGIGSRI
jgi:hypothetical protein